LAEKVGRIHVHDLPSELHLEVGEVYRCYCNVEFYVGKDKTDGTKGWWKVEDLVEYDRTVNGGQQFIGNATPDTEWDEVNDDSATTAGDASGDSSEQGGPGETGTGPSESSDGTS
jgi:hypothetical protein